MHKPLRLRTIVLSLAVLAAVLPSAAQAAPSLRSASSAATTVSGKSLTIPAPAGVAFGDVLVASVDARITKRGTITPPTGWTLIRRDSNTGGASLSQALYYHVAGSSEPTSYTWTFVFEQAVGAAGGILAYTGIDPSAPVLGQAGRYSSSTKLITAPGTTTSVAGAVVIGFFSNNGSRATAPPTGTVERFDVTATGLSTVTTEAADFVQASAGATGNKVATAGGVNSSSIGQLVALRPAPETQPPPASGSSSEPAPAPAPAPAPVPAPDGTLYVSSGGSDSGAGTLEAPFGTIQKALDTVSAGQTILVRAGTYPDWITASRSGTASAPITLTSYPGEKPVISGRLKVSGKYVRVTGLVFADATTSSLYVSDGDYLELSGNEFRGAQASAMFLGEGSDNVRIVGNWIHDNGTHYNLDHGIYFGHGVNAYIANNLIERNFARGIQCYPDCDNATITNNTVVRNGRAGIQIGGETTTSDNNLVVNNTVAYNGDQGIRTYWGGLLGSGNIARTNVVWSNANGNLPTGDDPSLTFEGTIVADPGPVGTSN